MRNQDKIDETNCNKTRGFIVTIVRNASIDILQERKQKSCTTLEDKEEYIPDGKSLWLHRARQRLKKLLMEDEEWWKDE